MGNPKTKLKYSREPNKGAMKINISLLTDPISLKRDKSCVKNVMLKTTIYNQNPIKYA